MRGADLSLTLVVGALAVFVGVQVAHAPHPRPAERVVVRESRVARPERSSSNSRIAHRAAGRAESSADHPDPPADSEPAAAAELSPAGDVAPNTVASAEAAPVRNLDLIHARIAAATNTYMSDMLADLGGQLVRWPDRRDRGLRIWVQSNTPVRDWDLKYAQMARDAFAEWGTDPGGAGSGGAGLPIRFDFILDSASSDVQIVWLDQFPSSAGQRVGLTRRTNDQHGWLVAAQIQVAIHDSAGRAIPPAALEGIVRHEAGHALGLGHSKDPRTKMYPVEMVSDITPLDRATLRLLYQLAPGPIK